MSTLTKTLALYAELARELGVEAIAPDASGAVQLTVGERTSVVLFAQGDTQLLVVVPVAPLPREPDYAVMAWLLRKNLYDAELAPFCIATDADANLVLWGRVPVDGMTGARLAGLLDALATEAEDIRGEVGG